VTSPFTPDRPLRADAARNRERLLEAARKLFAERGLCVTMDEIAHCAGVGVGTAYRRFSSRQDIADALFEETVAQVLANVERALADPDPWRAIESFLETHVEMMAANRGLKELLFEAEDFRARVEPVREQMLPMLETLFDRAKAAGVLRSDIGAADLPVLNHMLVAAAAEAPDGWRRYLALVLDGLRA
jgi:AcrR family transcriptional regulator